MPLSMFQAVHSLEGAAYLDHLEDQRLASAGIAIHMAWLEHSSSLEFYKAKRLLPDTPVDMLLLYQAAAATFEAWPPTLAPRELPPGGQVMNRQQAEQRLGSLSDPQQATLAVLFLGNVIRLSTNSTCEQDLSYLLELFLRCIQQEGVVDRIVHGDIKRREDQLADPDYW